MTALPIKRVVLYKHGVGYFEREGPVEGDATLSFTFRQAEVSDVLKSLTVLDLDGGHIASVSYDSTKPLQQLLADIALSIPDEGSLLGLLPQLKGARVAVRPAGAGSMGMRPSASPDEPVEGMLLGVDTAERAAGEAVARVAFLSLLTDGGEVRSFDLHQLAGFQILDAGLRKDLDYYLRTQLSAKKQDARTFTFFAQGQGRRTVRLSYTVEAPVWKATYRILLGEQDRPPRIQGWAVVDNTQDEDWDGVRLSLVSGLPVSFVHDLYTPRYVRRPVVRVEETTGVRPPDVESGVAEADVSTLTLRAPPAAAAIMPVTPPGADTAMVTRSTTVLGQSRSTHSSVPVQVRERELGDLFEYTIEHPVTIRRNQSALVPIVLRPFEGRPVLLYNKPARAENPLRCVEFHNTTGLTLEGGPITVLEGDVYVGEAMLETSKPGAKRLVPFAVELGVRVLDNIDSHDDRVHKVLIRRGQMRLQYRQVKQTTYHFDNKSGAEQTIYLDHPRLTRDWELADTPEPVETTENYWRFRFVLPAGQVTKFVVRQQHIAYQGYGLADASDRQLALWLEQRLLDRRAEQVLKQVADLRQQAARHEDAIQAADKEHAAIHTEQNRIRANLQALGDRQSERELRERFIRTLTTQEDRLEQLEKELREQSRARDHCRGQMEVLLERLEYEAEV